MVDGGRPRRSLDPTFTPTGHSHVPANLTELEPAGRQDTAPRRHQKPPPHRGPKFAGHQGQQTATYVTARRTVPPSFHVKQRSPRVGPTRRFSRRSRGPTSRRSARGRRGLRRGRAWRRSSTPLEYGRGLRPGRRRAGRCPGRRARRVHQRRTVEENVWTAVRTGAHVALGFSSLPADQYVEFDHMARDPDVGVIAAGSFSSMAAALLRAAAMAPNIRANGRLSTTPARPSRTRLYSSATALTR